MMVDAVVEAAIQLFDTPTGGGHRPTVRDIARRAGVAVGSVYDYFEGRDGVLDAVFERVTQENFDSMVARWEEYDDLPLEEALRRLLDDTFALYLGRRGLTQVVLHGVMRLGQLRRVTQLRDRFAEVVAHRIARELPGAPPDEVVRTVVACMDSLVGVFISEVQRPKDDERSGAARELVARQLVAELDRLRALEAEAIEDMHA